MISSVEVHNFQSLHHISLEPGRFTVIVGPSSSGKSAFTRALRTLTSNRRGNEFISHGERTASIGVTTDRGTVTLTRGKGANDNAYTVIPVENPAQQRTYTKLGGETPPEVSQFLGIEAKDPINYAGQFDKPYLLDDSTGEVARILGSLTNVNIIFDGARESNRRKLQHTAALRTRAEDLEAVKARVPQFRSIKEQAAALTRAEEAIGRADKISHRITGLTEVVAKFEISEELIGRWSPIAAAPVVSDEAVVAAAARLTAYRDALRAQQLAAAAIQAGTAAFEAAAAEQKVLEDEYAALVESVGDDLAGWFEAVAVKHEHDGVSYVTVGEAVRVSTRYIEERGRQE